MYGMLTWLPSVLPLESSAFIPFGVNNMPPSSLDISNFGTPQ
jgi:hypothetical protein